MLPIRRTKATQADLVKARAKAIIEGCKFESPADMSASKVERFLEQVRAGSEDKRSIGHQTSNFYAQSIQQFCRWMVDKRRWSENPLPKRERQNVAEDRRHDRRELSDQEVERLLAATYRGPERCEITGEQRALIYRLALEAGLRAAELGSLRRMSFDLDAERPAVHVDARSSKRGTHDVLPLRKDTAELIRGYVATMHPGVKVFRMPSKGKTARILRADLEAARTEWIDEARKAGDVEEVLRRQRSHFLTYQDEAGRFADFHCLRHTFLSRLA